MSDETEDLVLGETELEPGSSPGEPSTPEGIQIPKHRFDEVNGRLSQATAELEKYRKHGTLEEVQTAVKKSNQVYTEDELSGFDKQLMQIPAFQKVLEMAESHQQSQKSNREVFLNQAEGRFKEYAKELGLPEDAKFVNSLQALVTEEIRQDPQLTIRFKSGDIESVNEAYSRVSNGLVGTLRRGKHAAIQSTKRLGPTQPVKSGAIGNPETRHKVNEVPLSENDKLLRAAEDGFDRLMANEKE